MTTFDWTSLANRSGNPYKFLDYYRETDQRKFAGRDRDVVEIVARATSGRALVLYGRSGLGKTSVLLAGVFPALRERGFTPIYARTLESPVDDLCEAVSRELIGREGGKTEPGEALAWLRRVLAGKSIILVLDQFEEFFIRFADSPEKRNEFIEVIGALTRDPDLDVRVVFSLREDYLAHLDEFRPNFEQLFSNEYRLLPLTGFGARQAIVQPLIEAGIPYDHAVVSRVLDLLAEERFDPVLLQIICTEMYLQALRRDDTSVRLEESDVHELGDLEGVFERYIESALEGQPSQRTLVMRAVLDALITLDRTKHAITRQSLEEHDFTTSAAEIDEALDFLEKLRLIRKEPRGNKEWIELSHDRIVKPLLDWIDSDRQFSDYKQARNAVRNAVRGPWRDNPNLLLTTGHLDDLIQPHEERLRLDADSLTLLVHSAIRFGSKRFAYWAGRLEGVSGGETLRALRGYLARSHGKDVKLCALQTVERAPELGGQVADEVLALALEDPDAEVRKAAGRALSRVAGESQLVAVRQAFRAKDKASRRNARELAAELVAQSGYRRALPKRERWRASRRHRHNRKVEYKEQIRAHRRVGAWYGLLAGFVWIAVVALVSLLAITALPSEVQDLLRAAAWGLPVALAASPILGWRIAARAGAFASYMPGASWFGVVSRAPVLLIPLYLASLLVTLIVIFETDSLLVTMVAEWPTLAMAALILAMSAVLAWLCAVLLALPVRLCQPAVWPRRSALGIWLWSTVASLGAAMLAPAIVYGVVTAWAANALDEWPVADVSGHGQVAMVALFAMPVQSFFVFVMCVVLALAHARSPVIEPEQPPKDRSRALACAAMALAIALLAGWYGHFFGFGTIPLGLAAEATESGETIDIRVGPGLPAANGRFHSRWAPPGDSPVELLIEPDENFVTYVSGAPLGSNVLLLERPTTLAFEAVSGWPQAASGHVTLRSRPIPPAAEPLEPTSAAQLRRATFVQVSEGKWQSAFEGSVRVSEDPVKGAQGSGYVAVRIEPAAPQPDRFRGIGLSSLAESAGLKRGDAGARDAVTPPAMLSWDCVLIEDGRWRRALEFAPDEVDDSPSSFELLLRVTLARAGEARCVASPLVSEAGVVQPVSTPQADVFLGTRDLREAWWHWRAPASGNVRFVLDAPRPAIHTVEIYRAQETAPLTMHREANPARNLELVAQVETNGEYFIRAVHDPSYGPTSIVWYDGESVFSAVEPTSQGELPALGRFLAPITLTAEQGTERASLEGVAPDPAAPIPYPAIWWRIENTDLTVLHLSTEGSNFDTELHVFAGDELIAHNDDSGGATTSRISFEAQPDATYWVAVNAYSGGSAGDIVLSWRRQQSVADNDVFDSAPPLAVDEPALGMLTASGNEPSEPAHAGKVMPDSAWWRWTPSPFEIGSTVEVEVRAAGFRPYVAVYSGETLATVETAAAATAPANENSVAAYFLPREGATYRIAVGSVSGGEGRYVIEVR